MQKKPKKKSVYSQYLKNERGFNFISLLTMLTVIFLTLPFLVYALQAVKPTNNYEELAVYEFFRFVRDDILESHHYYIQDHTLYLLQANEQTASISKYDSLVRRQIDGRGHEIYLRGVQFLRFQEEPFGIKLIITTEEGVTYERLFPFYNGV
ncbi:ComGF family competence protein [Oceanobacillus alkalisoli]|uniref:ComGF family competence protein n=1 Tax=Oceanobacillus alkalisoli TaxID=2925113 RepID=UPI001F11D833|nr:ComGF family competence protein [Oceanobacillus alkalisoli]MCF3941764.1 ComGF family competence protein [Oceanobacillus alkalisoli]